MKIMAHFQPRPESSKNLGKDPIEIIFQHS